MSIIIHLCICSSNYPLTRLFVGLSSEEAGGAGAGGRGNRDIDARLVELQMERDRIKGLLSHRQQLPA